MSNENTNSAGLQSGTVDCPDCGGMVSRRAASCLHCGAPIDVDPARSNKDPTKGIFLASVLALLFTFVFSFVLKLEHDAAALQSRADDVMATATSMSSADEAIRHRDKARRLSGAATGVKIGFFVAVIVGIGAWLARRTD